jgi:cobalt-zinc-cadmium resistance protein CzcA
MKKFIIKTIENRKWIAIGFAVLTAISLWALLHLPIDAVPDITPVQVVINTKTGALDPEQIEKTISFPI